ncbi:secreted serine protease [Streptomyces bingchenggensis BCW-1]|uniref:Secreted serine protease n=1 Tax=Streptomyces bingchenggensis (strain BCW-1) TaxID=749414 RepID=D7CEB8_STRBB|nr:MULTISPECIES: S8 family peptidase [Streptomyces]ADI06805.1 secreted serine protease [Streptomyces bingchenggensis BCW-1]
MPHTSAGFRRRAWAVVAGITAAVLGAAMPSAAAAKADTAARADTAATAATADGSYIVTLKKGAQGLRADSEGGRKLAARYGARISRTYSTALNGYAVRANETQAERLAADPHIASVTPDAQVSLRTRQQHSQQHPQSWGLDRIDQPDRTLDASYTSPRSAGRGTTIYVLDTGVRTTHRDFAGRARSGWDFVDNDAVVEDGNGHGTHIAATAAGSAYGVAKRADIVAVKVLDDTGQGTSAQVLAGLDWVMKHAHKPAVVNLSLGATQDAPIPEWDEAVRSGIASGLTFTVAAGNQDRSAGSYSPGRVAGAITVGSTGRDDRRSAFSNWGPAVDLFAPGERIVSASNTSDTGTKVMSGTSMAAPHAAGAAALYLADHPRATPAQVSAALTAHAAKGKVRNAGTGSPNRLLQVGN